MIPQKLVPIFSDVSLNNGFVFIPYGNLALHGAEFIKLELFELNLSPSHDIFRPDVDKVLPWLPNFFL